jgi:2-polyprenyl-6-methoxyphenol hydroxylase-like FAD-dependent oxidoreductase
MQSGRCAVLGAGVGGLAVAIFLARQGWKVDVFEAAPQLRAQGSGFVLQPGGQAVLEGLGVWKGIAARGAVIDRITGLDVADGRTAIDLRVSPAHLRGVAVERGGVVADLARAARAAGVEIHVGRRAVSWDGGRVAWADGGQDGPWDGCVDATGAGGTLSPLKAPLLPYGAFWATVPWVEGVADVPDRQLTQRYHTTTSMVGLLPLGLDEAGRRVAAFFWSVRRADADLVRARGFEAWRSACVAMWPATEPFIQHLQGWDDLRLALYSHGRLSKPNTPGLARLGDASHRSSPQLGQGANMALLDAWAFSEALRVSSTWDEAAKRAARARAFHTWVYHHLSGVFTPQYQSDRTSLAVLRNRVFAPLGRLPFGPWALTRLSAGVLVPAVRGLPPPPLPRPAGAL